MTDTNTRDDDLAGGGYRFKDLQREGIVSSRSDLQRKQKVHGFPLPVKISDNQAWFPKPRVHRWLAGRDALRNAQK